MRSVLFVLCMLVALAACKKESGQSEPGTPDPVLKCRLIKTEYTYSVFPDNVITHLYEYDNSGRISSIIDTYGERDTLTPVYDGNTSTVLKTDLRLAYGEVVTTDYQYNQANQLSAVGNNQNRSKMYFKSGRLDSASREFNLGSGWFAHPTHHFVWNSSNTSITKYVAIDGTTGSDVRFELSDRKNTLRGLAIMDPFGDLYLSDMFMLARFGYADDFLMKKVVAVNSNRTSEPMISETRTFDYTYTFDSEGNPLSSEVKVTSPNENYTINRKYFYSCNN